MSTSLATYVDAKGKPVTTPESRRIESLDAVKLAKFFVSLGFTAEKAKTEEGGGYIAAKANGIRLAIFPSREPRPSADWSMTLMVEDATEACAKAQASGGTVVGPLKPIPGGMKCTLESPDGHRIVLAEKKNTAAPAVARPVVAAPAVAAPIGGVDVGAVNVAVGPVFGEGRMPAPSADAGVLLLDPTQEALDEVVPMDNPRPSQDAIDFVETTPTKSSLQNLRIASGMTAAGTMFSAIAIVLGFMFWTGSVSINGKRIAPGVPAFCTILAAIGVFSPVLGKSTYFLRREKLGNQTLFLIGWLCDASALSMVGAFAIFAEQPLFAYIGLILLLVSSFLFTWFLQKVGREVDDQKLASSARFATMTMLAFFGFFLLHFSVNRLFANVSYGFGSYVSLFTATGLFTTGVLSFLLYIALLVAFVLRADNAHNSAGT